MNLADLTLEAQVCHECRLSTGSPVISRGNIESNIMIIGEAPGEAEEDQGIPFVGAAGDELDTKLQAMGLGVDEVYITTTVLCRPRGNRIPIDDELKACSYFLAEQIKIVKPDVIIALGSTALKTLTGLQGIMKHNGNVIQDTHGYDIFPIVHPGSILHNPQTRHFWNQAWQKFSEYLNGPTEEELAEVTKPKEIIENPDYVHLHHHTEHSVQDAYGKIDDIVARLKTLGFRYAAITDHGTMSGCYDFYEKCKAEDIIPIIGYEAYWVLDHNEKKDRANNHLTLLAKNLVGYKNLLKLSTLAHRDGFYYKPRIDNEMLKEHSEGLICLSGCVQGSEENIPMLRQMFNDDFYIELMAHNWKPQIEKNTRLISYANQMNIKMVLTNDCHYIRENDVDAYSLINKNASEGIEGLYIKTWAEMREAWFKIHPDVDPEVFLKSVHEVQAKIEQYEINPGEKNIVPEPIIPDARTKEEYFDELIQDGWMARIHSQKAIEYKEKVYHPRLEHEIEQIKALGFMDYFLIIHEYLGWCKKQGIAYQCRGSVGGSLVAYCMYVTNLDPVEHDLIFERFISPNRNDLPDIDVDVEDRRRDDVIDHLRDLYGSDNVAHMEVLIRMSGKLCLREIGRFLDVPYSEVNAMTSFIVPASKGDSRVYNTIEDSWEGRGFKDFRASYPEVLPLARKLEGSVKTKGTHAAGIFIAPKPLYNYMPLEKAKKVVSGDNQEAGEVQGLISAYSPAEGEKLGLLKLDVLASNTLTVIKAAQEMIENNEPYWDQINYNDKLTFFEFSEGHTLGVHQFDGSSITQLTKEAGVTCFEDLCALNALHRPGPLESGVAKEYVKIKQGLQDDKQIHPIYDKICKSTHGLIIYQEQVFRILREIGLFEWDDVNKVRKLVSKSKGQEAINEYRKLFLEGAMSQEISSGIAGDIFNAIVKYGRYGFNKAHSALYSSLSFKCMYLKTHYPTEYMISLLTHTQKDKLFEYVAEASRLNVAVRCPNVNRSKESFSVYKTDIYAGLIKLKGVGKKVAEEIIQHQPYDNARDFLLKTKVSKEVFFTLIQGGGFDGLYMSRKALFDQAEKLYEDTLGLTSKNGSLEGFVKINDGLEEIIWDNSHEDWDPIIRFDKQLKVLDLPSDVEVVDAEFLRRFPMKQLSSMMAIPRIKRDEPDKTLVIGWLKTTAKLKKEVRTCVLTDEFGRSIELVAFKMAGILDGIKDYAPVVAHLKKEENRGRTGYILERFEPIIL